MNLSLFIAVFFVLGVVYMIVGAYASRSISSTKDYFLAGRSLGIWPLCFTLVATHLGGGVVIGTCDSAYSNGIYGIFYTLGISLGLLILGCGFASKLRSFSVATIPELLEKRTPNEEKEPSESAVD